MNIYYTFQFKKVRKMQNLGKVYIWGSPSFVMSRTDAQNGVEIILKCFAAFDLINYKKGIRLSYWCEHLKSTVAFAI